MLTAPRRTTTQFESFAGAREPHRHRSRAPLPTATTLRQHQWRVAMWVEGRRVSVCTGRPWQRLMRVRRRPNFPTTAGERKARRRRRRRRRLSRIFIISTTAELLPIAHTDRPPAASGIVVHRRACTVPDRRLMITCPSRSRRKTEKCLDKIKIKNSQKTIRVRERRR